MYSPGFSTFISYFQSPKRVREILCRCARISTKRHTIFRAGRAQYDDGTGAAWQA